MYYIYIKYSNCTYRCDIRQCILCEYHGFLYWIVAMMMIAMASSIMAVHSPV